MGNYINTGNMLFRSIRKHEYVDKSGLIAIVNGTLDSEARFSCVSRSRRFGKSMAAKMLCAYYDCSCDSRALFADLAIAGDPTFDEHLNQYLVLYLDMSGFVATNRHEGVVDALTAALIADVRKAFPDIPVGETDTLMNFLLAVTEAAGKQFIFIIDEWDAILREFDTQPQVKDRFVDWLRAMFKDTLGYRVFAGVYMTGILPIKKYNTQSALNNFTEYSMIDPAMMAPYFGFSHDEVRALAGRHGVDFAELEKWYDGYTIGHCHSMFNPHSVMQAVQRRRCINYWTRSSSYDAAATYIKLDYEGLREDMIAMLGGERRFAAVSKFSNDMSDVQSHDDVLTLLIHLGYLSYDFTTKQCFIPNHEVGEEMAYAVEETKWPGVVQALRGSEQLLADTLAGDAEAVARGIEAAHEMETSVIAYNNENSLACVLSIAYIAARDYYKVVREMPTGKGFADLVLLPRKGVAKPAIVLELKWKADAVTALDQIRARNYPAALEGLAGNILLVGIAYDRDCAPDSPHYKHHTCVIEQD